MTLGLPNFFFGQLGYYVVLAGHIEHTMHEMLPGLQSGVLDQGEIKARKNKGTLLKSVRTMANDLPDDLRDDVMSFCDLLDERSRYRHRAVHGAWFRSETGPGVRNLYFSRGEGGHLSPEPLDISPEEITEAILDIEQILNTAYSLRDRIRDSRSEK